MGYFPERYRVLDRRSHPRAAVDCLLYIERLNMPGGLAGAIDLSPTGIRFQCVGCSMSLAEVVQLQFTLEEDTFRLFGTTVRVRRLDDFAQEVALSFSGMSPGETTRLSRNLYGS